VNKDNVPVEDEAENPDAHTGDADWQYRRLCADGNCIGVIGKDGKCGICGRPGNGNTGFQSLPEQPVDEGDSFSKAPEPPGEENTPLPDLDWENRKLCKDGNCIGVIGEDGKCRICGTPL
jgi:hypothetical protein